VISISAFKSHYSSEKPFSSIRFIDPSSGASTPREHRPDGVPTRADEEDQYFFAIVRAVSILFTSATVATMEDSEWYTSLDTPIIKEYVALKFRPAQNFGTTNELLIVPLETCGFSIVCLPHKCRH